ncbi:single-stranded DNA-binding protein [Streptomyces wuyuanensis]|uniref:single-stranded DNA-binding protein n=1 Tax=Streptomyces wuyuanensis TaxID=1196353 RepID=UPI003D730B5C
MSDVMVTLVGNVATAVEYRESASGGRARFRFAVPSRRWDRQRDGWTDGPTSFFTVWAWRALGANLAASVAVGEPLVVYGRLRVREEEWEGKLRTSVDVDAVAAGHDLTRGTSAFRRVTRTEAQPTGYQAVAATAMAPPPFVPPAAQRLLQPLRPTRPRPAPRSRGPRPGLRSRRPRTPAFRSPRPRRSHGSRRARWRHRARSARLRQTRSARTRPARHAGPPADPLPLRRRRRRRPAADGRPKRPNRPRPRPSPVKPAPCPGPEARLLPVSRDRSELRLWRFVDSRRGDAPSAITIPSRNGYLTA